MCTEAYVAKKYFISDPELGVWDSVRCEQSSRHYRRETDMPWGEVKQHPAISRVATWYANKVTI